MWDAVDIDVFGGNDRTHYQARPAGPPVSFGSQSVAASRTDEAKAAKKFLTMIGNLSFNAPLFAYVLTNGLPPAMTERVMEIVKAIIQAYANQYDAGWDQGIVTRDARRLQDCLDTFAEAERKAAQGPPKRKRK